MHEAALAQIIAQKACDRVSAIQDAEAVGAVYLRVGEFRNVDPQSLEFAFDNIKVLYDRCQTAELKIETVKPRAICQFSHVYSACPALQYRCPYCSGAVKKFLNGEELEIVGIEFVMKSEDIADARDSQRAHTGAASGSQRGACSTQ